MCDKIEQLAEILAEIHAYSFVPFYDKYKSNFWSELKEISSNHASEVDKDFFRKMALFVTEKIVEENNKVENLAKILYDIHSSCLVPFYKTEEELEKYKNDPDDYWFSHSWESLEDDLKDNEKVDKIFFIEMAGYIIVKINL